jgi:uncharacterized GH25 family protein
MLRSRRLSHVLALGSLALPSAIGAHDFWIEPSTFTPRPVSTVRVRLRVGEELRGEAVRRPEAIEQFVAISPRGTEEPIAGPSGSEPAGFLRVAEPGTVVLGYRSHRSTIRLEPAAFAEYLRHEGLDAAMALRRERGEEGRPGHEVFSRCAKSLLAAGGRGGAGFDHRFGWPLELVPQADPATLAPGAALSVLVLRDGRPVGGVLVAARSESHKARRLTQRSDARGLVDFTLDDPGEWLVSAVHMVPAPDELDADWESFWASLTFEIRSAGGS